MSSEQRSNSAVRNLRSIFENKTSESPSSRGRSPGNLGDLENQRPRSKIRSSFIPVEPTMAALAAEQNAADSDLKRESSVDLRRASFSESNNGEAIGAARDTVNAEQERREKESSIAETIPETAVETPGSEPNESLVEKMDKQAENPDKHVTGAEEEPVKMTPANPGDEAAVSGGQALPPVAEDLRKSLKATSSKPKPTAISTRGAPRTSSIKSPASQPKTPVSNTATQRAPTKKTSRSSLTAPTAASVARAAAADKASSVKQSSPVSKPKPREVTKPAEVSSRLTAPTAATRARQEGASSAVADSKPAASSTRPKPTASARPTPRTSLARPESRSSQNSSKKPSALVDGSFLERMMRPTAASTNRAHEKVEAQAPTPAPAPAKKQLPLRPKTNGHSKKNAPSSASTDATIAPAPETSVLEDQSILPEDHDQATASKDNDADQVAETEAAESETPLPTNGDEEDATVVETSPAAPEDEEVTG